LSMPYDPVASSLSVYPVNYFREKYMPQGRSQLRLMQLLWGSLPALSGIEDLDRQNMKKLENLSCNALVSLLSAYGNKNDLQFADLEYMCTPELFAKLKEKKQEFVKKGFSFSLGDSLAEVYSLAITGVSSEFTFDKHVVGLPGPYVQHTVNMGSFLPQLKFWWPEQRKLQSKLAKIFSAFAEIMAGHNAEQIVGTWSHQINFLARVNFEAKLEHKSGARLFCPTTLNNTKVDTYIQCIEDGDAEDWSAVYGAQGNFTDEDYFPPFLSFSLTAKHKHFQDFPDLNTSEEHGFLFSDLGYVMDPATPSSFPFYPYPIFRVEPKFLLEFMRTFREKKGGSALVNEDSAKDFAEVSRAFKMYERELEEFERQREKETEDDSKKRRGDQSKKK